MGANPAIGRDLGIGSGPDRLHWRHEHRSQRQADARWCIAFGRLRCTYQWCPGSPELKNMPNWDRNVCHPWYFDQNSPVTNSTIIEGFPPPRPPSPPCIPFINCLPGL
ncbi:hypothetical protein [Mycobacterium sp. 852002-53434_SCH5985345]|uniref:hypothetical protein n=1 Tax=Mycobacterium sp. 852002-53434_SCH5985345 TaxID=1834107 RepID=UPI0012E85C0F|nr:hypothetical protein [Mycobacterium sp. 852002-53434_SCH5985345]